MRNQIIDIVITLKSIPSLTIPTLYTFENKQPKGMVMYSAENPGFGWGITDIFVKFLNKSHNLSFICVSLT